MSKYKFIEFIGGAWLNGKSIAAYRVDADTVQLRAETTGGKIISRVLNVSNDELEALKAQWAGDDLPGNARIVARSLAHFGVL